MKESSSQTIQTDVTPQNPGDGKVVSLMELFLGFMHDLFNWLNTALETFRINMNREIDAAHGYDEETDNQAAGEETIGVAIDNENDIQQPELLIQNGGDGDRLTAAPAIDDNDLTAATDEPENTHETEAAIDIPNNTPAAKNGTDEAHVIVLQLDDNEFNSLTNALEPFRIPDNEADLAGTVGGQGEIQQPENEEEEDQLAADEPENTHETEVQNMHIAPANLNDHNEDEAEIDTPNSLLATANNSSTAAPMHIQLDFIAENGTDATAGQLHNTPEYIMWTDEELAIVVQLGADKLDDGDWNGFLQGEAWL